MTIYVNGACVYISSNSSGMTALLHACAVREDLVLRSVLYDLSWLFSTYKFIESMHVHTCPTDTPQIGDEGGI